MALTTDSWKVNADGDWGVAANWSAGLPNSNSNVVINTANIHTVTYSGGDTFTVNSLTVGNDFFDMTGGSLTILTTASFANGFTQTGGTLSVGGGVTIDGNASLTGGNAEGKTQLTIDGTVALANYTLGGSARLTNTKTTNLTGGITLGDNSGIDARITNETGATFDIAGDFGINQGAASASFVNAGTLEKSAGSNTSFIGVGLTDTGAILVSGGTLEFGGPQNSFEHSISGAGVFALGFGSKDTINSGTTITTGGLLITDPGTLVTLGGNLAYAHTFNLVSQATLSLSGGTLTLSGSDTFSGSLLDGAGQLVTKHGGSASLSQFTLGGAVIWQNAGIVGEAATFQIGDASFNAAIFINERGGVYEFTNDGGIAVGAALNSSFVNDKAALFEKIGGSGTSAVQVAFEDQGTIFIRSGTIEFTGFDDSFAGTISGGGQFAIGSGSQSEIGPGATIKTGGLLITDGGTVVTLGENLAYAGRLTLENSASLGLGGFTLNLSGTDAFESGALVQGPGALVTAHGATTSLGGLTLAGGAHWQNAGTVDALGALVIGDAGFDIDIFTNEKGGIYDFVSDGPILIGAQSGSSFVNSAGALVEKTNGTGDSVIQTLFTNSGAVKVATGEIEFTAAVTGNGSFTIEPGAQLRFDGAVAKGSSVDFAHTTGGLLALLDSRQFAATIHGFGGRNTDSIFLGDVNFSSGHFRLSYAGSATEGVLTVTDGTDTAHLTMFGHYRTSNFHASADGAGTLIVDPPWHDTLLASAR